MAAASEAVLAAAHVYRDLSRSIYSGLQAFLNDSRLSDIILVRPDGRQIQVHQVILAACSRRFATVLANGDATGKELPIQGVDSAALESVIGFFYRGECLLTPGTVVPIYDVCLKLEVPGLAAGCEQYMQQNLSPQTCPTFLEASVQLLLEQTIKQCLEYAKSRFDDVVATSAFQSLSSEAVRLMLTYCRASAGEMGLARALARWAVCRTDHPGECEAMFKELNITTTVLLQLLQSPDFVAGLQAANPVTATAEREAPASITAAVTVSAGAGTVTSSAATTQAATGPGSGSAAVAAAHAQGIFAEASGLDGLEVSVLGLPAREAAAKPSLRIIVSEGLRNHAPLVISPQPLMGGRRSRQLQQMTPAGPGITVSPERPRSPGSSSAGGGGGRTEREGLGGGLGSGTDRDSTCGQRPHPLSLSKGERRVHIFAEAAAGGKRQLVTGASSAAGPAASAGSGGVSRVALLSPPPPPPQQQQQVFQGRLGAQMRASGEDCGIGTNIQLAAEAVHLSQPLQEACGRAIGLSGDGGGGGGVCGVSTREEAETPRMRRLEAAAGVGTAAVPATIRLPVRHSNHNVAAAEITQPPLQHAHHAGLGLATAAAVTDDIVDASSPRSADSGGSETLFAIPLSALEMAGLTLHLLPSGALAASGGALGPTQLPLQIISTGTGPHTPLLALLPRAVVRQLQQPPIMAVAEPLSRAGREPKHQQCELTHLRTPLSLPRPAPQQQHQGVPNLLQTRGSDRGSGGLGRGAGEGSRLPLLLDAAADDCSASGLGGGRGDTALTQEVHYADALDLQMLSLATGGAAIAGKMGNRMLLAPPSRRLSSGKAGGTGGTGAGLAAAAFTIASGSPSTTAKAAPAAPHLRENDAVGSFGILGMAAGGPDGTVLATSAAALGRGGRGGLAFALGGSGGGSVGGAAFAADDNVMELKLLAQQYGPQELGSIVPQFWLPAAAAGDSGTAAGIAVATTGAAHLAAGRAHGGKQASMPLLKEGDLVIAADGGAACGSGGEKRRRPSMDGEEELDTVEDGNGGVGGGGGSRAAAGGSGARGGGRSAHSGRAGQDGVPGGGAPSSKLPLMCHVDGCHVDLANLKEYHQRFRICDFHLKAETVVRDGVPQRFCQQCGRFHKLSEFDGTKRSCRTRLIRHNARRRKRPDQRGSGGDQGSDEPRKARVRGWRTGVAQERTRRREERRGKILPLLQSAVESEHALWSPPYGSAAAAVAAATAGGPPGGVAAPPLIQAASELVALHEAAASAAAAAGLGAAASASACRGAPMPHMPLVLPSESESVHLRKLQLPERPLSPRDAAAADEQAPAPAHDGFPAGGVPSHAGGGVLPGFQLRDEYLSAAAAAVTPDGPAPIQPTADGGGVGILQVQHGGGDLTPIVKEELGDMKHGQDGAHGGWQRLAVQTDNEGSGPLASMDGRSQPITPGAGSLGSTLKAASNAALGAVNVARHQGLGGGVLLDDGYDPNRKGHPPAGGGESSVAGNRRLPPAGAAAATLANGGSCSSGSADAAQTQTRSRSISDGEHQSPRQGGT